MGRDRRGKKSSAEKNSVADVYYQYMKWAENKKLSGLSKRTIADRKNYWGEPEPGKENPGKLYAAFAKVDINALQSKWILDYYEARSSQSSPHFSPASYCDRSSVANARDDTLMDALATDTGEKCGLEAFMQKQIKKNNHGHFIWLVTKEVKE